MAKEPSGAERRVFTRVDLTLPLEIRVADTWMRSTSPWNLSATGVFMRTPFRLPVGMPVTVRILLGENEEEQRIRAFGSVVRTENDGIGVRFEVIEPGCEAHLRRVILHHAKEPEKVFAEFQERFGITFP